MTDENVLYEDDYLLVLDKPAGVIVNRSDTTANVITLQDIVEKHLKISYPILPEAKREGEYPSLEEVFASRSGIVHRLDKETSGIILVAKNKDIFERLQKAFKEREVHKEYVALVHGNVLPKTGDINAPVGREQFNRMRFGVVAGGKEANTHYSVDKVYIHPKTKETLSLVKLFPKTGRTHQIRVHMKYIGYPLISDELYTGRKTARNDRKELTRIFLHASGLSFIHPVTKKEMTIHAPLPLELDEFLKILQAQ